MRLKKLTLRGPELFSDDFLCQISFRLTEFDFIIHQSPPLQAPQNLKLFLMSQRDTIEVLRLGYWIDDDTLETVLSMPRLKKLIFSTRAFGHFKNLPEKQNHSVVDVCLRSFNVIPFRWIEYFVNAFPKVQSLTIRDFDDSVANLISESCKFLERLTFEIFCATNIPNEDFYLRLKEFNSCYGVPNRSQQLFERLNGRVTH